MKTLLVLAIVLAILATAGAALKKPVERIVEHHHYEYLPAAERTIEVAPEPAAAGNVDRPKARKIRRAASKKRSPDDNSADELNRRQLR